MPRQKMYYKWDIPTSVVNIVKCHCADYDRRTRIILNPNTPSNLKESCFLLNSIIDKALCDVDAGIQKIMLSDVSLGRGYESSMAAPFIAKNSYYARKRKLIHDIALGLKLR